MVMSVSFLTVLNVSYSVAWPVLVALTIDALVTIGLYILLFMSLWVWNHSMQKEKFHSQTCSEAKSSKYSDPIHSGSNRFALNIFCSDKAACGWISAGNS